MCKNFISQLKDIRLQLEGCESHTIHKIRSPLDKDPVKECAQRITDQQVCCPCLLRKCCALLGSASQGLCPQLLAYAPLCLLSKSTWSWRASGRAWAE